MRNAYPTPGTISNTRAVAVMSHAMSPGCGRKKRSAQGSDCGRFDSFALRYGTPTICDGSGMQGAQTVWEETQQSEGETKKHFARAHDETTDLVPEVDIEFEGIRTLCTGAVVRQGSAQIRFIVGHGYRERGGRLI